MLKKSLFLLIFMLTTLIVQTHYANTTTDLFQANTSNNLTVNTYSNNIITNKISVSDYIDSNKVTAIWDIPASFYLYQKQFNFELIDAPEAKIGNVNYPPSKLKNDPNLGQQKVYFHQVYFTIPIYGKLTQYSKLNIYYQGCDGNICLPIQMHTVNLSTLNPMPMPIKLKAIISNSHQAPDATGKYTLTFSFISLLTFLGIGILLSFTPCVLPMIPIISGLIIGANSKSKWKNFNLCLLYVLGMAFTYTILGLIVSSAGANFQAFLQSPIFIISGTIIFILLAISMFGVINLQLPDKLRMKIHNIQDKQHKGSYLGAFIMGVIATAVISPCTSAPLIGVLTYIAQTGDQVYGAISLFTLAIGMGIPLIIIATGFAWVIPKAGTWMIQIKNIFGIIMLAMAIWLLSRILTNLQTQLLVSIFICITSMFYLFNYRKSDKCFIAIRSISLISLVYGLCLFIGVMMGNHNYLTPLLSKSNMKVIAIQDKDKDNLIEVNNLIDLGTEINKSNKIGQTVILDFYASWCSECQILTKLFEQSQIQYAINKNNIKLIKVNVSKYSTQSKELLDKYKVLGLPTLITIQAYKDDTQRISGNITSQELIRLIKQSRP